MAFCGLVHKDIFVYVLIIAINGLLTFILAETTQPFLNDYTLIGRHGTKISTKVLTSTKISLEAVQEQKRVCQELYANEPHLWNATSLQQCPKSIPMDCSVVTSNTSMPSVLFVDTNSTSTYCYSETSYIPYQFGYYSPVSGDSFHNDSFPFHDVRTTNKKRRYVNIIILSLCAILGGLLLAYGLYRFFIKDKRRNIDDNEIVEQGVMVMFNSCTPRPFTFEELSLATDNFHQDRILGMGGFGAVYKAVLTNGKHAAVKRVSNTSQQGVKEYKAEVMIVSRLSHKNLVQLIGWCHESEGELLVVYELMEQRSLDAHLFSSEMAPLPWDIRYKIAQGLAKAIHYLHEECAQHCVLHRDIKASNVLLDSNFEAKLSDFGLARVINYDQSLETSVMAGTRGYLAPECVLSSKVSSHSDVYSYGVVALEIATGRKTIDLNAQEDQKVLVKWVQSLYKTDRILEAVDPKLGEDYNELQMKGLIILGLWCVHHDFNERPSMSEIVRSLDNIQDPLSDLLHMIPSLVHDPITQPFDITLQSSPGPLPLETGPPSPMDSVGANDPIHSGPTTHTYHRVFMWPHIPILHRLWHLIGMSLAPIIFTR